MDMIDVDERGRAAAADLHRAVGAAFDTDEAWQAVLAGTALPVGAGARPRRRLGWAVAAVGVAATITIVALVAAERAEAPPAGLPATSVARPDITGPTSVPPPTSPAPLTVAPVPVTSTSVSSPAPTTPPTVPSVPHAVTSAMSSVQTASVLPAVVSVSQPAFEVAVDGVPLAVPWYPAFTAVQAPDGRLVIERAGDAFGRNVVYDAATGMETQIPEADEDGMRVNGADDVATIDGVDVVVARRADPCNTEGAPCSRGEVALMPLVGGRPPEVVIALPGTTIGGEPITGTGRFSLSDSGLVAGVVQLSETANVALLIDSTAGGDPLGPSATALGIGLGLNTGTGDPARRIDSLTVDQTGTAVAWLGADGVTVADLLTGERRTFPWLVRPASPLPVLDLALATPGISDGAVLLSAPGEAAFVLDLTDGSVVEVPGFAGTLTFSAANRAG
jgi:hypothetical protein